MRWGAVLLVSTLLTPALALGQPPPPLLTDTVNDFANVIDPESRRELDRRIRALQQATGDAIVIATVKTYKPDYADIREYAVEMFENHRRGIGARGKDNGLLIVLAIDDRQIGIEVGYGLEGAITDGSAGQVRDLMRPYFREQAYGRGLLEGTTALITRIASERGISVPEVPRHQPPRQVPITIERIPCGALLLFALVIWLMSRGGGRRRRRRRYWGHGPWSGWNSGVGPFGGGGFGGGFGGFGGGGLGGGGGGFGGFGGGRSGGGGAAGGW